MRTYLAVLTSATLLLSVPALAESGSNSERDTPTLIEQIFLRHGRPAPPGGACDGAPLDEQVKFDGCSVAARQKLILREKAQREDFAAQLEAESRERWSWLNGKPQANCSFVPRAEFKKFSCVAPEKREWLELSAELAAIRSTRDALAEQIRALQDKSLGLDREEREINGALQSAPTEISALDMALTERAARRALLDLLADRGIAPSLQARIAGAPRFAVLARGGDHVIRFDLHDAPGQVAVLMVGGDFSFVDVDALAPAGADR